jgi:predicted hydrolase (HD superfamily)
MEVKPKSVRKKMKDKAFARQVSREDLVSSAELLGVDLNEHIAFVVEAMTGVAAELGLDGSAAK